MSSVRAPAAAGFFYPARGDDLAHTVDRLVSAAHPALPEGDLRALVAPHAGYDYSGAVAASAFAALGRRAVPLRVALLGPSHFVPITGAAVSSADAWRTPVGTVLVDDALRADALTAGAVADDRPHTRDHALEVQLPFLQQHAAGALRVLPVAVGQGSADEIASLVAVLAQDALVVVSTDLSHYHDAATAHDLDRRTAAAVVALDEHAIGDLDACGASALRGLLAHARRDGWTCTLLDLRTSADTAGDAHCVVGYGAFALTSGPQLS